MKTITEKLKSKYCSERTMMKLPRITMLVKLLPRNHKTGNEQNITSDYGGIIFIASEYS